MLNELAEYAHSHGLAAQAGFKQKPVKGYVYLSAKGEFLGIQVREKGAAPVYAPYIGSAAQGIRYCNPLIEKAKIPLCIIEDEKKDKNIPAKFEFFLSMMEDGETYEPGFHAIASALRSDSIRSQIIRDLKMNKLKSNDPIGFAVDGEPMEQSSACARWWSGFRTMFGSGDNSDLSRCLVTGELAPALATVPKVSGLMSVGGHTAEDAFLCFDKDAFQSYGLKKSANASVSEEAMTAVNAALTDLIGKAPILGGAKLVHWYAGDIPENVDLFGDLLDGIWFEDDLDDEHQEMGEVLSDDSSDEEQNDDEAMEEDDEEDTAEKERDGLRAVNQLVKSIYDGERPGELSARYYIMPLSGAGGRMMVRGWYEGSFEELYANINQWFEDLKIVSIYGKGMTKPPKLKALYLRLLSGGRITQDSWKRMDKELKNLSMRMVDAIISGNQLPDEVAARALRFIRSAMLSASDDTGKKSVMQRESLAFQLLKAWLVRRQRQRGDQYTMGADINTSPRTVAYCCGRLMAVYSAIQSNAMPDVNSTVSERYYAAASSTPAFVIGKLAQLSQHHLSKLEGGLPFYYQSMLDSIYSEIGSEHIPTTLNQEQQTEFALGYYQQRASMYAGKGQKNDLESIGQSN